MSWMTIHTAVPGRRKKKKSKNQNTTHHQKREVTEMKEIITISLSAIILGLSKPK